MRAATLALVELPRTAADPPRWRVAAQLLAALDRHGWSEDYQPLSIRGGIHTA